MRRCITAISFILLGGASAMGQVAIDSFPKLDANRDWPWWRGVTRDGHVVGKAPRQLDESSNLDWSTPVPGRGHGSPVVVGNRIFLITADEDKQQQFVIAYDRESGQQLWQYKLSEGGFPESNHPKNTEASPTVACDGSRVIANVFHHRAVWVTSLTLDGKLEWEQRLGDYYPNRFKYGYAPSPVLYGDNVIVAYEYDGPSALVALRRTDGAEVWRTERPGTITFSSPVITSHQGQDYLLISGYDHIRAYDPANGKELWSTPGAATATCGTMVWSDGVVFASGGYPQSETIALDIKTGKALWKNNLRSYEQSMVADKDAVYAYTDSGVLYCWDAKSGEEFWRHRLANKISASGVLADGKIYWANEAGDFWVFEANSREYVEVSSTKIGTEAFASPAICGGQVFLRVAKTDGDKRQEYLMRFSDRTSR